MGPWTKHDKYNWRSKQGLAGVRPAWLDAPDRPPVEPPGPPRRWKPAVPNCPGQLTIDEELEEPAPREADPAPSKKRSRKKSAGEHDAERTA